MTIKTKFALSINLLLMLSMGILGYGIVAAQKSYVQSDLMKSASVIENSVKRMALDTLLQGDELQLVSYFNFLRGEYPALAYARFNWNKPSHNHKVDVGDLSKAQHAVERRLHVADPGSPTRFVDVLIGIDESLIKQQVRAALLRLEKIVLVVWALASLAGVGLSLFLAGSLTEPIIRLSALADRMSQGKLGGKIEWHSKDEVGLLVNTFNDMSSKLETLDETKKQFVSSVSHELRSPLGAISSFLNLIEDQLRSNGAGAASKSLEYVARVHLNIQRLQNFVGNILDTAKIEQGKFECILKPMPLAAMIQDAFELFRPRAAQQGVRLLNNIPAELPRVLGDSQRLGQVVINLISNSLKFTPKGGSVRITAEQYREGEARFIELAVSDDGCGMDQQDLKRMFKIFSQGQNVSNGTTGPRGTGLGLFISKSIIEQHGGAIKVKSEPGKGTTVTFSIKVAPEKP